MHEKKRGQTFNVGVNVYVSSPRHAPAGCWALTIGSGFGQGTVTVATLITRKEKADRGVFIFYY